MAESRQTTGAVHITSLDIDITKAIEDLKTLQEKVQETVDGINNTKPTIGSVGGEDSSSGGIFRTSIAGIESLNLQYRNFLNTLTKSKLEDSKIAKIAEDAQKGAEAIKRLTEETKNQTRATPEQTKEYQRLQSELKELKGNLADTEANARKTGEGFKNLGSNADQSASAISKFLGALSDKVKWMAAFQVINLIQNAFNNVIGTIRDTEDAVIEIQRVLNDPSLADSTVSQRIYDIAYDYGQTFENVQEVFTRFAQAGLDFEQATKATEAAMLGLNTAELDVSTATQGLIAIMAQFGYTADDLTSIIDKINITADNFAVTSEKIVAGLQRAGGTANAFGLTLEETIGIITALSEATGRSGEQIGTALNSLISFTEKASSLSKFSEFLGADASQFGVLELWQKLADKIRQGDESLAHMMSTSEEFNDLYSEEIASAIGATEEFNKAQMEAQGIYSTVGTYRQNYFIALLNNIDTAIEAMNKMNESEGYSLSENEKAMSRLTAQWNQLVVAAQELAVQFGEVGFLDLLKLIANLSTGTLRLTKDIGGLRAALGILAVALGAVKAQKINEYFSDSNKLIPKFLNWIKLLTSGVDGLKTGIGQAGTAIKGFINSAAGAVTIFGLVVTAINASISAYQRWKQAQEEARQATIDAGLAAVDSSNEIKTLYSEYEKAKKSYDGSTTAHDNLTSAAEALIRKLKEEGASVEELIGDYTDLGEKIEEVTKRALEDQLTNVYDALSKQGTKLVEMFGIPEDFLGAAGTIPIDFLINVDTPSGKTVSEILEEYGFENLSGKDSGEVLYELNIKAQDGGSIVEMSKLYNQLKQDIQSGVGPALAYELDIWQELRDKVAEMQPEIDAYNKLLANADELEGKLSGTSDNLSNNLGEQEEHIIDLEKELTNLADEYERVESKLSNLQSSYATLIDAVDEYNDTGILTSEMLEELLQLEPEYISLLEVKNGQLSLNKDGVDALVNSTYVYMQQMVALQIAEEAEALATDLQAAATNNYTLEQFKAQAATAAFSSELYTAVLNMIQGKGSADELSSALRGIANSAQLSGEWLEYFNAQFQNIFSGYAQLLALPRSYTLPTSSNYSAKRSSDEAKAAKESLQSEIKSYQDREKAAKEYYGNIKDEIKESRNAEISALKDELSAAKEYYGNAKKEAENYYDSLIDSLNRTQEENSRVNAQLDYYANRQKSLTNLEQAQSRSGIEWREKEMEYQQELMDLDEEWRRKQSDWDLDDRIKELEREKNAAIQSIEDTLNAITKGIEAQIENLENLRDAEIKNIEAILKAETDGFDAVIAALQEQVNNLSASTASSISTGIANGFDTVATIASQTIGALFDGLNFTIEDSWNKTAAISGATAEEILERQRLATEQYKNEMISLQHEIEKFFDGTMSSAIENHKKSWNSLLTGELPSLAYRSATTLYEQYQQNFISPLRQNLLAVLLEAQNVSDEAKRKAVIDDFQSSAYSRRQPTPFGTTNFNMYNNISGTSTANTVVNTALGRLNTFR